MCISYCNDVWSYRIIKPFCERGLWRTLLQTVLYMSRFSNLRTNSMSNLQVSYYFPSSGWLILYAISKYSSVLHKSYSNFNRHEVVFIYIVIIFGLIIQQQVNKKSNILNAFWYINIKYNIKSVKCEIFPDN